MLKKCLYCDKMYPEEDFGVAVTLPKKVYRRRKCRHCYRKTKKLLLKKHRRWLDDYKKRQQCTECGVVDFRVLDFHHNGTGDKDFNISEFYGRVGFDKLKQEIKKCVPLCANCHRIVHYESNKNNRGVA